MTSAMKPSDADPAQLPNPERTLLLADDADPGRLVALADSHGWKAAQAGAFYRRRLSQIRTWAAQDDTLVFELDHYGFGTRFVSVAGPDTENVETTTALVARALPTLSLDDVVAALLTDRTAPADLLRGLRLLQTAHLLLRDGHSANPADPRLAAVVERLLRHPDRQVRLTTMLFAEFLRGVVPELAELVIARQGAEVDLLYVVEAFAAVAAKRN
jgi:hypothetical protein